MSDGVEERYKKDDTDVEDFGKEEEDDREYVAPEDMGLNDMVDKDEEVYCANCNQDIREWLQEGKPAYHLTNMDMVCTKRCLMEYTLSYIMDGVIIQEEAMGGDNYEKKEVKDNEVSLL